MAGNYTSDSAFALIKGRKFDKSASAWILEDFPRYGGCNDLTKEHIDDIEDIEDIKDEIKDFPPDNCWLKGILTFFILPMLLPLFSFFICPIWCCFRCRKGCGCCKRKMPKNMKKKMKNKLCFFWSFYSVTLLASLAVQCIQQAHIFL